MNKNFLIAVKSCVRDRDMHTLIRDGWFHYLPDNVSLRFFMGGGDTLSPLRHDEIQLDVPDDYEHLPEKVRGICDWVTRQGYDHVMLIDNDTFIHPQRLLEIVDGRAGFEFKDIDYFGKFFWKSQFSWATTGDYRFAFGGLGYILSYRAAALIAEIPTLSEYRNEDEWVGRVMYEHGPLFRTQEANRMRFERYVSWHYPKDTYRNERYTSDSLWQRVMMLQHLGGQDQETLTIDDREPFPRLSQSSLPDLRNLWTLQADIDKTISRLLVASVDMPEEKLLDLQHRLISLSLLREIEGKSPQNILRSEWEAMATAYKDLGQFDRALQCAWVAYEDRTPANQIKLAQACDAAGRYKLAHNLLLNLYTNSKDYNLLPLLRVAAKRAQ